MAPNPRIRDKIRTLERQLGFYTERGLSRTPKNKLTPTLTRMIDAIDDIKKTYIKLNADELQNSEEFDTAWRALFWDLSTLWPESDENEDEALTDTECYPRRLVFLEAADRKTLEDIFRSLVIEKCLTYQRNQAAKPYREKRMAEARQMKDAEENSRKLLPLRAHVSEA